MSPIRSAESVWDYPRPPRLAPDDRHVLVRSGDLVIAETMRSARVLETSHPPVFYLPPEAVRLDLLTPNPQTTVCEFKGQAAYWDLAIDPPIPQAAWSYPLPVSGFEGIAGWFAFYPSRVACFVDGIRVEAQEGKFYGGWITPEISGPFKGGPGTAGW